MRSRLVKLLLIPGGLVALSVLVYFLPPVHTRLAWRVSEVRARIQDIIAPPEKVVFRPQDTAAPEEEVATMVAATLRALTPSPTACPNNDCSTPTVTPTPVAPVSSATQLPTSTPTITPTSIPAKMILAGVVHEYQTWNNCGPANLAMELSFWKWKGTQKETAAYLKPNERDKNVMPYEMKSFVEEKTDFKAVVRMAGDLSLLKQFIAAGFPVIVEKGFEGRNFDGWMGHYEVVNGYDDGKGIFITQDSYIKPNLEIPYADMESNWRAFNDTFIVVYPPGRENQVLDILGPQAGAAANFQYAAQKAADDLNHLTGRDLFFAYYNRGTSLVNLLDYAGAAAAFDKAYEIYPSIPEAQRPYRMEWYQTGPYYAYYYTGRYNDVISLATKAIGSTTEPAIEESWVWRARAEIAIGDRSGAIDDLHTALKWHPDFSPALDELQKLGVTSWLGFIL